MVYTVHVEPLSGDLHRIEAFCDHCGKDYSTHVDAPKASTPQHVDGEWYGFIACFLVNHDCTRPTAKESK